MTFALNLAAGLVCVSGKEKPCGVCAPCRKAAAHAHPDIITVYKAGKQKFTVDQSRELRRDMLVRPNEAEYKIYILPDALYANDGAQNALLKVLEEPPEYGVVILLVKNAEDMLPTVRSRCVRVDMQPLPEALLGGMLKNEFPAETEARIA
jgi:DNA polymerase-3 subunit delta'